MARVLLARVCSLEPPPEILFLEQHLKNHEVLKITPIIFDCLGQHRSLGETHRLGGNNGIVLPAAPQLEDDLAQPLVYGRVHQLSNHAAAKPPRPVLRAHHHSDLAHVAPRLRPRPVQRAIGHNSITLKGDDWEDPLRIGSSGPFPDDLGRDGVILEIVVLILGNRLEELQQPGLILPLQGPDDDLCAIPQNHVRWIGLSQQHHGLLFLSLSKLTAQGNPPRACH